MLFLIFIAVAQIILEVLPVSSSGHLNLLARVLEQFCVAVPSRAEYFDEFLHLYTIVVVLIFFRGVWVPVVRRLWAMIMMKIVGKPLRESQKNLLHILVRLLGMLLLTTLVTTVAYFFCKEVFVSSTWQHAPHLLMLGFSCTATLLYTSIVPLAFRPEKKSPWQTLLLTLGIACAQACAVLPGISRFAATTMMGMALGLSPRRAVQWSWVIFVPLMTGAGLVHGVWGLLIKQHDYAVLAPGMVAACTLAAVVSYGLFAFVYRLFERRQVWAIGLYMLLPIITIWFVQIK
jgi:undecaprenyl-diphosphatase